MTQVRPERPAYVWLASSVSACVSHSSSRCSADYTHGDELRVEERRQIVSRDATVTVAWLQYLSISVV